LLGGHSGGDEILVWDATNEEWKEMGRMKQTRYYHAVAVVDVAELMDYCT